MGLTAGHTIVSGIDTGRVFSPSQLIAFRQKVGLANVLSATERAAQSLVAGAAQANATAAKSSQNDEITKFIRGGQSLDDAADGVSKSKILERGEKLAKVSGKGTKSARKGGEGSGEDAGALSASLGGANADVDDIINRVADSLGMDPSLIRAVIKTESNFDNKAVSIAGAKGLMQLMPGTAKEMGVKDPFNPLENIWGGARYLKRMLDSYGGNLNKALAAYNWGPGNVNKHGTNGNMPRETRRYIEVVNKNYNRFKKDTSVA
ncbi:MAG: lytic transglycosylase domain-containing protein [Deltaproteobacteria bacterium]|nr:lytic transglycosylase domain-containing protein [Deltaproteobacteria bacterium]